MFLLDFVKQLLKQLQNRLFELSMIFIVPAIGVNKHSYNILTAGP